MGALNRSLRVVQAAPASHFDRSAGCLREIHSERLTGHCFLHPRAKRGGSCPTTDPEITEKLPWSTLPYTPKPERWRAPKASQARDIVRSASSRPLICKVESMYPKTSSRKSQGIFQSGNPIRAYAVSALNSTGRDASHETAVYYLNRFTSGGIPTVLRCGQAWWIIPSRALCLRSRAA